MKPANFFLSFLPSHVSRQEGATDADLSMLAKYRYQVSNEPFPRDGLMVPVETSSRYLTTERVLLHEDAVKSTVLSFFISGSFKSLFPVILIASDSYICVYRNRTIEYRYSVC